MKYRHDVVVRIVVAGGSGFLGTALRTTLQAAGHEVIQLVRREATKPEQLSWDPAKPIELPKDTAAVINLCGAGVGDRRWTDKYREEIRDSRVTSTTTLADAVARQGTTVFINASGVGFYGDNKDREVDESSPAGDDFLAGVVVEWEAAAARASAAGCRVVVLRTGWPLDRRGGFLQPQLLPFKLGVGGKLGDGRHWIPWISLTDWLRAAQFVLASDAISGPVNMVGPSPVTNAEFTKALARALHRPAIFRIPRHALRVLYGQFGDEVFTSLRVLPKALRDNGFEYKHSTLPQALDAALR